MSRPLRITLPNLPFHILNRGNNRQSIFLDDEDFIYFIHLSIRNIQRIESSKGRISQKSRGLEVFEFLSNIRSGLGQGVFGREDFIKETKERFKIGSLRPNGRPRKNQS